MLDGQYGAVSEGVADQLYPGLMCCGIAYPWGYDTIQLIRSGLDYFKDAWNWTDIVFQYSGIVNIVFQFQYQTRMSDYLAQTRANPDATDLEGPDDLWCTVTMTIVLLMALFKTFFFLRISDTLAYLVTLIRKCIVDLKIFLLFYVILIYMFALIVGVLGWQVDTGIEIDTMEGIL